MVHVPTSTPPAATAPQPGRWRRFFRLSLRTLLLLVVLLAVWLGITFNRVRQQRAAVARIEQLGGSVQYLHELDPDDLTFPWRIDEPVSPGPPWLRRLLGPEFFETVVAVELNQTRVTDADLRIIGKLRGVVVAQLNCTSVSDAGLYELRNWRKLRSLGLMDTQVTGAGLRHLASMPELNNLVLEQTAVDDQGLARLGAHKGLTSLSLGQTRVTSRGVEQLRSYPELSILSLHSTPTDDSAVPALVSLRKLDYLDVTGTNISVQGLLVLCNAWPRKAVVGLYIDLSGQSNRKYTRDGSLWLQVVARACALDSEDRLKLIDFSWSNIQDEHLAGLHGLKNVELIDLRGSEATPAGIAELRKALPHCEVLYEGDRN